MSRQKKKTTPGVNVPYVSSWSDSTTRLLNMTLFLLHQEKPVTYMHIINHVEGYEYTNMIVKNRRVPVDAPRDQDSALRLLREDIKALATIGIYIYANNKGEVFPLRHSDVFLPPLNLSSEEFSVLEKITQWTPPKNMVHIMQSATEKLRALGMSSSGHSQSILASIPDHTDMSVDDYGKILRAIDRRLCIKFQYYKTLYDEPVERTFEPWALGTRSAITYLIGWDVERQDQRIFRLARINNVEVLPRFAQHQRSHKPAKELIEHNLYQKGSMVSVRFSFTTEDGAWEIRDHVDKDGWIHHADREKIISAAVAYAPIAIVEEPASIREEVIATLRSLAE